MEEDKVEYEENRLGLARASRRDSGGVTSAFVVTPNGKTAAVNVLTIDRRTVRSLQ